MPACGRVASVCLCVALGGVAACDAATSEPRLVRTDPAIAFDDQPTPVALLGEGFVPRWQIDLGTGHRQLAPGGFTARIGRGATWIALRDLVWRSESRVDGTLAPGLPVGVWDVELTDPRGAKTRLASAFTSSGSDAIPPDVYFIEPRQGAPIATGGVILVHVVAFDAAPGRVASLAWAFEGPKSTLSTGLCDPAAVAASDGRLHCRFDVPVPPMQPGDRASLRVTASDNAVTHNRQERTVDLEVVSPPRLTDFTPRDGSVVGGNDIVLFGAGFLTGTRVYVGDELLVPDGGVLLNDRTISGRVPAHAAGTVDVRVETPIGPVVWKAAFVYRPAPTLEAVVPNEAPAAGGAPIEVKGRDFSGSTVALFGRTRDEAVPLAEAILDPDGRALHGLAPAGLPGPARVWVVDRRFGAAPGDVAFTWVAP